MNADMVSIVVPVYNAERFLPETIGLVQKQTYRDWELILVDDCSSDNGAAIVRQYAKDDTRIRLIQQEVNAGAARSRNLGISQANGRYLCFLDADDIWTSQKLEKELAYMKEKKAAFVFTGY